MSEETTNSCWAVTYGAYSDYGVAAIFTDKELFDAYVEACLALGEKLDTEEFPLNPNADVIRRRLRTWYVRMDWDGNVLEAKESSPLLSDYPDLPAWHPVVPYRISGSAPDVGHWSIWIVAKDQDTAIKATNERRLIAMSEGPPREWEAYYKWLTERQQRARKDSKS